MADYLDLRPSRSAITFNGTVTAAGTPQLVDNRNVPCVRVWVQASEWNGDAANCPNGGVIVVGGNGIIATLATRRGKALYPTQGDFFNVRNLNLLWVDSLDSGAKYHGIVETNV